MKTFLLSTCFLFLFLSRFCVSVTSFSSVHFFSTKDADEDISYEDDSNDNNLNIDKEEEEFEDIREGFGDIVDPDEDEDEEGFPAEDEEEEYEDKKFDMDTSEPFPVDGTRSSDSSDGHSSRQEGCFCSNETSNVICKCFGDSVKSIPKNLTSVSKLTLTGTGIESFPSNCFKLYSNSLEELNIISNKKLVSFQKESLKNLRKLHSLYITKAPRLTRIPWKSLKMLKFLRIKETGLESVHLVFPSETELQFDIIDIENNRIRNLSRNSIHVKANGVNLDFNSIQFVEDFAFNGSHIYKLSLKGNRVLTNIGAFAFDGLRHLKVLDLSETNIVRLPTIGLHELEVLKFPASHDQAETYRKSILRMKKRYCPEGSKTVGSNNLVIPTPDSFSETSSNHPDMRKNTNPNLYRKNTSPNLYSSQTRIQTSENDEDEKEFIVGRILNETGDRRGKNNPESAFETLFRKETFGRLLPPSSTEVTNDAERRNGRNKGWDEDDAERRNGKNKGWDEDENDDLESEHFNSHNKPPPLEAYCGDIVMVSLNVKCFPEPDALNPCEDVMGNVILRISVWIVAVMAVLGNLAVLIVLCSSRFTMTVSKFLMCNLAIADLMMGIYLLMIAFKDIQTIGVYFNHALDWQEGVGCQAAGFITVLASELSIYSLTVITLERWYAITYAIHLNRRLKLGLAIKVMIGGWIYSIFMALLPNLGVSGYSRTSICLPMEHGTILDVTYLTVLLTVNAIAFTIICLCYGKMYLSIVGQQTRATLSDLTVAKRMALLVFTDFACWAPIAFFGLTAVAGHPLISVTNSKFLLVFFYPLNSCANPYLYAILTKQYRRDFFILTSRYGFCSERAAKYKGTSSGQAPKQPASRHESPVRPVSRSTLSHDSQEITRRIECRNLKVLCQKCKEESTNTTPLEESGGVISKGRRKCRCLLYSTMDPIHVENSLSSDSTHEIIKIECINSVKDGATSPARKVISALKRPFASNDTNISLNVSKNAAIGNVSKNAAIGNVSKNAAIGNGGIERSNCSTSKQIQQQQRQQPEGERSDIIRRFMDLTSGPRGNKLKSASSCNSIHKSHKNCTSFVQRDSSSSGEKSSHSQTTSEGESTLWVRRGKSAHHLARPSSRSMMIPIENPAFSHSSHSNTLSNASPAESQF